MRTVRFDLAELSVRDLNDYLHHRLAADEVRNVEILNPNGLHNIAVGLDCPVEVNIRGNAGYFIAAMNKQATVTVHGSVGWSLAENIMSGVVRVKGNTSECTAASGNGGTVIVDGDAASRCGISMKGCDIIIAGSVGHMSGFMAQAGHLLVCGDAGSYLGDSLYEAVIYVGGKIRSLGTDAREESMSESDYVTVAQLLSRAEIEMSTKTFKRVASAKTLYHWNSSHHQY